MGTEYFVYNKDTGKFLGKSLQTTYDTASPSAKFSTDEILKLSDGHIKSLERQGYLLIECNKMVKYN